MFNGEVVYCEWQCIDDETNETIAKGNANWYRLGRRMLLKMRATDLYRDVYAPDELLYWIRR